LDVSVINHRAKGIACVGYANPDRVAGLPAADTGIGEGGRRVRLKNDHLFKAVLNVRSSFGRQGVEKTLGTAPQIGTVSQYPGL